MIRISTALATAGLALTLGSSTTAGAAEITLLCSNALKTAVEELVAPFEKATDVSPVTGTGEKAPEPQPL